MGLKRRPVDSVWLCRRWFQTNPCGIEAIPDATYEAADAAFQTNPCGIEASETSIVLLVGVFQTNPCGIEAGIVKLLVCDRACFRRTLVGLKRDQSAEHADVPDGFRRTLVGLKLGRVALDGEQVGFRRTLVGLKH